MKTCGFLCNQINFEPTGIQPCCDVRALGVPSYPFAGGPLPVDDYVRHVADVLTRLQTGSDCCAGCPELHDDGKPLRLPTAETFRIAAVSVNHHRYFCNCKCTYCDLWAASGKKAPYDILPALESLAEQGALSPQCVISWGGGEPGLLREFPAVCRWGAAKGIVQYVHTNALLCSPAITELLAAGKGLVNISLDSGDEATYRKVKGVDGWNAVMASLETYAAACRSPEQIDLKYIIFDDTNDVAQVEKFFQVCLRFGIRKVQYSLNFKEINRRAVSAKTLIAAAFFKARATELGLDAESFYIDPSMAARIRAYEAELFAPDAR